MARVPMVTRTIATTHATVMVANTTTATVENVVMVLPRTYKDDALLLKKVKAVHDTETLKCVAIVSSEVKETLYGMTEDAFIEMAKVLPARGTKEAESEE